MPQKSNPISDLVKNLSDKYKAGDKETTGLGDELHARAQMNKTAESALDQPAPEKAATPSSKPTSTLPYGSKKGEKRLDTSYLDKPSAVKVYDKGGKVNVNDGKHEVAILKHGERVLTQKQNEKYEKSNPAEDATEMKIYDQGGKVATPYDMITGGKKAPKTIQKHEYSRTHNGKHVVTHKHHAADHKDETHMFDKFSEAADHMNSNPPQPEPEAATAAPAAGAGAPPAAGAMPPTGM
jgi:hypothetical protein